MSRSVILGVDGGGGTTECILADCNGKILGKGLAGGSNVFSSGEHTAAKSLKDSMLAAGLQENDKVISACFGLSGVIHGLENPSVNQIIKNILPDAEKYLVVCDAISTLTGSIGLGAGICVNAGTGSICAGRNFAGELAISSGWGHLLGDEGSGYWIGSQGLISALRSYDGRSEKTILLDKLLGALGTDSPQVTSMMIHESADPRLTISKLCPIVLSSAESGDAVAYEIVRRASFELALAVWGVTKRLALINNTIDVAPVGNCLLKSRLLNKLFCKAVKDLLPLANVVPPKYPPVVGSLLLALMEAGVDFNSVDMESYTNSTLKQQLSDKYI